MKEQILALEDNDVSVLLTQIFKNENIKILTKHKAIAFEKKDEEQVLICENSNKDIVKVSFDKNFVCLR